MKIFLVGPPGSGKSSLCPVLRERYSICHLNANDLLQDAIMTHTDIGVAARESLSRGQRVSDDVFAQLVSTAVKQRNDCAKGFVLDGLPRTDTQARQLTKLGVVPDALVVLEVPDDEVMRRTSGRWVHRSSGRIYHEHLCPPKQPFIDDVTGEELEQRVDDRKDVVSQRLIAYHKEVDGVREYYQQGASADSKDTTKVPIHVLQVQDKSIHDVRESVTKVFDQIKASTSRRHKVWWLRWL